MGFAVGNVKKFVTDKKYPVERQAQIIQRAKELSSKNMLENYHAYSLFGQKRGSEFLRDVVSDTGHILLVLEAMQAADP